MNAASHLAAFYTAPLVVWVEDPVTRDYLDGAWMDPDIRFLIAGGNENIRTVVESARTDGHTHVFGVVDRDFRATNRSQWSAPTSQLAVFIPDVHEVENYLIGSDALAGCALNSGGRTATQITTRLRRRARAMAWWMACRKVLYDLRDRFTQDFPRHPACPAVTGQQDAEQHILNSSWYRELVARTNATMATGAIRTMLQRAHSDMQSLLAGDGWRREFSGKELLHDVRDWLYVPAPGQSTGAERDSDVAKAVARWQVDNNAVPPEVRDFRTVLRGKVGLP